MLAYGLHVPSGQSPHQLVLYADKLGYMPAAIWYDQVP